MPSARTADQAGPRPPPFQPDRFCDWLGRALSTRTARCRGVRLRADGSIGLEFTVGRHGRAVYLRRRAARNPAEGRRPSAGAPARCVEASVGRLFPPEGAPADLLWQRLAEEVALGLARLVDRYHVPLFDLFAPAEGPGSVTFAPGLFERRIGPFLLPGRTRIGGFVYVGQALTGEALRYSFESATSAVALDLWLGLDPVGPEPAPLVFRTAHLSARIARDERTEAERAERRTRVEDYLGFLLSLADAPALTLRMPTRSRSVVVDSTPLEWGARMGTQFFFDEPGHDFLNLFKAAAGLRWPVATLFHGERECGAMGVCYPAALVGVVPSPLDAEPMAANAERTYVTDLTDAEAIGGGEPKLRERLAAIAARPDLDAILVGETCLARVLGDDVAACVEAVRPDARAPIVHIDSSRMDHAHPFLSIERIWRPILEQVADRTLPTDPSSVNLVGYGDPRSRALRELGALLDALGIRLNAALFPYLERDHARRFCQARCHVVSRSRYVQQAFEAVARWSATTSIEPPGPYGRCGTRAWLDAVAQAVLGRSPATSALPDFAVADGARWERLVARAAEHGLAFVVPCTQTRSITDDAVSHGIPLVALAFELGFRVTVLLYDPAEAVALPERVDGSTLERELVARVGGVDSSASGPPSLRLVPFDDEAELAPLLADPAIDLVYSEFRDDPRVRRAGKGQVTALDFEMGLAGALRTLERLVARARSPFHRLVRRYGRSPSPSEQP